MIIIHYIQISILHHEPRLLIGHNLDVNHWWQVFTINPSLAHNGSRWERVIFQRKIEKRGVQNTSPAKRWPPNALQNGSLWNPKRLAAHYKIQNWHHYHHSKPGNMSLLHNRLEQIISLPGGVNVQKRLCMICSIQFNLFCRETFRNPC